MKPTTVLLDAGGVIIDESEQEEIRAEIAVEVLREIVPGYTVDTYWSDIEEAVRYFCPRTYEYVFWKYLKDDRSLFDRLYVAYSNRWNERKPSFKLAAGLDREVRAIARRLRIGIAGQYGREMLDLLEARSLLEFFTYRFTQDDFAITKPDPRYYEQIVRACGIEPQECIMVGDRIDKDVIPAKQLGISTILIRVGLHRNQQPRIPFEVPDAELESISGLAEAVFRIAEQG